MRSCRTLLVLLCCIIAAVAARAQSTQGLISGRVLDRQTGRPVAGARIRYTNSTNGASGETLTGRSGLYAFPLLSPGTYRIEAAHADYQGQDLEALDLPVAAFLDLDFELRPLSDVWERGRWRGQLFRRDGTVITLYGPDLDTTKTAEFDGAIVQRGGLEATISQVIDRNWLSELPLAGRDAYTLLITQPGVTSDTGTTRSLGLSVNGQRPSASHFLLDGLENDNALVTGPLTPLPPEALQEYRISTNNFAAEYGGTSGFLANGITTPGGREWHGTAYIYAGNELLNANGFASNASGLSRVPARTIEPGASAGGPVYRDRLFGSLSFDLFRFHTRAAARQFVLPTQQLIAGLPADSIARQLLDRYPPPQAPTSGTDRIALGIAPAEDIHRVFVLPRADYSSSSGSEHIMARVALSDEDRPNLLYSPYSGFSVPLKQRSTSSAVTWVNALSSALTNEARVSVSGIDFRVDRPHPEIPTLAFTDAAGGLDLPGSKAFYSFRNRSRNIEGLDNVAWVAGRHLFKFGAGLLRRSIDGYLTPYGAGIITFFSLDALRNDAPDAMQLAINRQPELQRSVPDFNREYHVLQWHAFAQDSYRLVSRLTLSYGVRYDSFGAPANAGRTKDLLLALPSSGDPVARLQSARFLAAGPGNQPLYRADNRHWAVRTGLSYSLRKNSNTVLRGGYGIFYDRPFDNIWRVVSDNNYQVLRPAITAAHVNYLDPYHALLPTIADPLDLRDSLDDTYIDPRLHAPRIHSAFVGLEQRLGDALYVEVNALASRSHDLVTTDVWNRSFSADPSAGNPEQRYNARLGDVIYRSNQGRSEFRAVTASIRYRRSSSILLASYTLSRSKDNQSDPVSGEFFDLSFGGGGLSSNASFARRFDPGSDWGNSEFDQRHNFVFASVWELPGRLHGWQISALGAVRSGFPFTVVSRCILCTFRHNPADRVTGIDPFSTRTPAPGGVRMLNSAAFAAPVRGALGNAGRNSLYGPGIIAADISLARRFRPGWLGESGALTVRADAFNVLNHANLNNPIATLENPQFGLATYGRTPRPSAFQLDSPLSETGRRIQLALRFQF